MGPRELSKLGLNEKDLIPVEMKLGGANGSLLKILGGIFLILAGTNAAGKRWETKQLCYVAEGVQKLLLSREACVKLGILSSTTAINSSTLYSNSSLITAGSVLVMFWTLSSCSCVGSGSP